MKKLSLIIIAIFCLFSIGCQGFQIFPDPPKPYCTEEEQKDSLIYKNFNPDTADFFIAAVSAGYIDKYEDKLPYLIEAYDVIEQAVKDGLSYNGLFTLAKDELGKYTFVVISRYVNQFKGINIPISVCDKRLILGHIVRQKEMFRMLE